MSEKLDSNARCLKAVELTFRFVLTCFVPLGLLLLGICLLLETGYKLGLNIGIAIVVLYFTVAYRQFGRGNKASRTVAALAGITAASAAAGACWHEGASDSGVEFNPATGLMMLGYFDTQGNAYGFGELGGASDDVGGITDDDQHGCNL